ncbi:DUF4652 domain-containing protein [Clostridium bovifaecis]|uniref:DUF4652 domain-containing protein n=1 Tax=Clostridium bovifaecis TaxID=2184719 RepID=A0A6I6ES50_9CLOT|nr:DUF4652 domain-containing protein [Clostridium bovifaecis]
MKNSTKKLKINICYMICIFLTSAAIGLAGCSKEQTNENKAISTNKQKITDKENTKDKKEQSTELDKNEVTVDDKDNVEKPTKKINIKFAKHQLEKNAEPKFSTSWQDSINKKVSVCIEGKGPDALEEGIGKIYVRDLISGERWSLDIVNGEEQNSPKFIEWLDDENIIVIVGLGYGTVSVGGSLYKLNVNTAEISEVYNASIPKQQVVSAKKVNDKLELQLLVYDDEDFIKSHTEKKILDLK